MPLRRRSTSRACLAGVVLALGTVAAVAPSAFAAHGGRAPRVTGAHDVARRSPVAGRDCNVATPYYTSPGGKEYRWTRPAT